MITNGKYCKVRFDRRKKTGNTNKQDILQSEYNCKSNLIYGVCSSAQKQAGIPLAAHSTFDSERLMKRCQ